jgi:riboflavin synthase
VVSDNGYARRDVEHDLIRGAGCPAGVTIFTGLVQDLGTVHRVDQTGDGVRLSVRSALARELSEGDSVAVNGVCLTAVGMCGGELFGADVMHETLRRSSLGRVQPDSRVNLELPLRAADRLGGHIVQGHVDGLGVVRDVRDEGFARIVTVDAEPALLRYVVEKGSIAVDGVSLTVAEIGDDWFSVSLIPETLERTTLGTAGEGTTVNLEVDVLAKYVEKLVASQG